MKTSRDRFEIDNFVLQPTDSLIASNIVDSNVGRRRRHRLSHGDESDERYGEEGGWNVAMSANKDLRIV